MPDTPSTPGQICYDAWRIVIGDLWLPSSYAVWRVLTPVEQAAWEAAAQAVLRQAQGTLTVDLDPDILREEQRRA